MLSMLLEGLAIPVRKQTRTVLLYAMNGPKQCALRCPV